MSSNKNNEHKRYKKHIKRIKIQIKHDRKKPPKTFRISPPMLQTWPCAQEQHFEHRPLNFFHFFIHPTSFFLFSVNLCRLLSFFIKASWVKSNEDKGNIEIHTHNDVDGIPGKNNLEMTLFGTWFILRISCPNCNLMMDLQIISSYGQHINFKIIFSLIF